MATPIHKKTTTELVKKYWKKPAINLGVIGGYLEKNLDYDYSIDYFDRPHVTQCKFIKYDLNKTPLPFDDNYFGLVSCFGTIHYIENVQNFIDDIFRILKPEGAFILSITNAKYLTNTWGIFQRKKMSHQNLKPKKLRDMLKKSGFFIKEYIDKPLIKTHFRTKCYYSCIKPKEK